MVTWIIVIAVVVVMVVLVITMMMGLVFASFDNCAAVV